MSALDPVEAYLAQQRAQLWRPGPGRAVPTTAEDAARAFDCTALATDLRGAPRLGGQSCAQRYRQAQRTSESATGTVDMLLFEVCRSCEAGAARAELLQIGESGKPERRFGSISIGTPKAAPKPTPGPGRRVSARAKRKAPRTTRARAKKPAPKGPAKPAQPVMPSSVAVLLERGGGHLRKADLLAQLGEYQAAKLLKRCVEDGLLVVTGRTQARRWSLPGAAPPVEERRPKAPKAPRRPAEERKQKAPRPAGPARVRSKPTLDALPAELQTLLDAHNGVIAVWQARKALGGSRGVRLLYAAKRGGLLVAEGSRRSRRYRLPSATPTDASRTDEWVACAERGQEPEIIGRLLAGGGGHFRTRNLGDLLGEKSARRLLRACKASGLLVAVGKTTHRRWQRPDAPMPESERLAEWLAKVEEGELPDLIERLLAEGDGQFRTGGVQRILGRRRATRLLQACKGKGLLVSRGKRSVRYWERAPSADELSLAELRIRVARLEEENAALRQALEARS